MHTKLKSKSKIFERVTKGTSLRFENLGDTLFDKLTEAKILYNNYVIGNQTRSRKLQKKGKFYVTLRI